MKRLWFIISVMLVIAACSAKDPAQQTSTGGTAASNGPIISAVASGPADINIQVQGLSGGVAKLIGVYAENRYLADSSAVDANGKFRFANPNGYTPGLFFVLLPDNSNFQLLLDQDQEMNVVTQSGAMAATMQVTGSLDNELMYQSFAFEREQRAKFDPISQRMKQLTPGTPEHTQAKAQFDAEIAKRKGYLDNLQKEHPNSFFTKFKIAGQNPELKEFKNPDGSTDQYAQVHYFRTHMWDNVDFNDERLVRTPVILNKLKRYLTELTVQHPDSLNLAADFLLQKVLNKPEYFKFFANWITLQYEPTKTTLMDPEAVFTHMVQTYFTYERAFWSDSVQVHGLQLRAHEMSASLVGKQGPNVTAKDQNGQTRSLLDSKKPYIVVYMYDPNCDNCAIETPKLAQFYQANKSLVDVFGIVLNTNDQEWKNYIAKNGLQEWTHVYDPTNRAIYATYFVDHTPEIYVLNPDRKIIAKNLKTEQIAEVINRDQSGS